MLLDFRKAKNTSLAARVFLRFFTVSQSKHGNFPPKVVVLNNYCGHFIKDSPNGLPCLDNVFQTLGMLLDFRKAKNTSLAARVFLRFFTVSQSKHGNFPPKVVVLNNYRGHFIKDSPNGLPCLDNVIQTLGMLLDFRKAKNTRQADGVVFLRFSQVSQTENH